MRLNPRRRFLPFLLLLTPALTALADFPDKIELSPNASNHGLTTSIGLEKTGEAERKFLFFPIYKMAHYLELPYTEAIPVHLSNAPRAVHLIFQRKIAGSRIQADFLELLQQRCDDTVWAKIEPSARAYATPFAQGNVTKGDRFTLEWSPESGLVSTFNGKVLSTINDPAFTELLWSVWTGPDAVVDTQALLRKVLEE